jgi:DNA-binding Lrp family transcriptional regulator
VATADLAAYQTLRDEQLATLPGVQRLTSTIVMKRVVDDQPYPTTPTTPTTPPAPVRGLRA